MSLELDERKRSTRWRRRKKHFVFRHNFQNRLLFIFNRFCIPFCCSTSNRMFLTMFSFKEFRMWYTHPQIPLLTEEKILFYTSYADSQRYFFGYSARINLRLFRLDACHVKLRFEKELIIASEEVIMGKGSVFCIFGTKPRDLRKRFEDSDFIKNWRTAFEYFGRIY